MRLEPQNNGPGHAVIFVYYREVSTLHKCTISIGKSTFGAPKLVHYYCYVYRQCALRGSAVVVHADIIFLIDCRGRTVLISDLDHPFGLALHGDYIYWTDWLSESIQRVNKITGEGRITIVDYVEKPMDIQAVSRNLTTPGIIITVISVALFELLVWPHEVESWFHSWYRGRVETLDANIFR